jgi:hypothetical protein
MSIQNRTITNKDPKAAEALFAEATDKVAEIAAKFVTHPENTDAMVCAHASKDTDKTEVLIVGEIGVLMRLQDMAMLATVKQLALGGALDKRAIEDIALRMTYLSKSHFIEEDEFSAASDVIMPTVVNGMLNMIGGEEKLKAAMIETIKKVAADAAGKPKLEPEVDHKAPRSFPKPPSF